MVINGKWMIRHFIVAVVLFLVAAPLGDKQNGLGKHSAFWATVGQSVFITFLIVFVLLIPAGVLATVNHFRARTPESSRR